MDSQEYDFEATRFPGHGSKANIHLPGSIGPAKLDAPSSCQYECNRVSEQVEVLRCAFVKSRSPLATKMFFFPAVNEH